MLASEQACESNRFAESELPLGLKITNLSLLNLEPLLL